jgi:hypothetical protein
LTGSAGQAMFPRCWNADHASRCLDSNSKLPVTCANQGTTCVAQTGCTAGRQYKRPCTAQRTNVMHHTRQLCPFIPNKPTISPIHTPVATCSSFSVLKMAATNQPMVITRADKQPVGTGRVKMAAQKTHTKNRFHIHIKRVLATWRTDCALTIC